MKAPIANGDFFYSRFAVRNVLGAFYGPRGSRRPQGGGYRKTRRSISIT